MTPLQKKLVRLLLAGHYMVRATRHSGTPGWRVYDAQKVATPLLSIGDRTARLYRISLYKADKNLRYTLNLTAVRGLRGNHFIKAEYKKLHQHRQLAGNLSTPSKNK